MQKFLRTLMLAVLMLPFASQAQETLTVNDGTNTNNYVPFYGLYADTYGAASEVVFPSEQLAEMAGSSISSMTFYLGTPASAAWTGTFQVYLSEIAENTLSGITGPTSATVVYTGLVDATGSTLTITFTTPYEYQGGNLLFGSFVSVAGNYKSAYFSGVTQTTNTARYRYTASGSGSAVMFLPKTTFTYEAGGDISCYPVKGLAVDESQTTTESITLTWIDTSNTDATYIVYTIAGTDTTEVDAANINITGTTAVITGLNANTPYTFGVKADCGNGDVTAMRTVNGRTACGIINQFPWEEDFESYTSGLTNIPCWSNYRIVDGTGFGTLSSFKIYVGSNGSNSTHQLQLADMPAGTMTKLLLPEMNIPEGENYMFTLDVYRNTSSNPTEGIRVFVSADTNLDNATELAFISRNYTVSDSNLIPAEASSGWYNYELPLGMNGTVYIIIRGESQYGSSTYMDNFKVKRMPNCPKPTNLAASQIFGRTATLAWRSDAANWQVEYKKSTETVWNEQPATDSTIVLTDLAPTTTYNARVKAICSDDESDYSREISFTTKAACQKPTNLAVVPTAFNATVTWRDTIASAWQLQLITVNTDANDTSDIIEVTDTVGGYLLDNLTPEHAYIVRLWADCGEDDSLSSVVTKNFTTLPSCLVPTQVDVTLTPGNGEVATLSWVDSIATEWEYMLIHGTDTTYEVVNENPVEIEELIAESEYKIRLRAICGDELGNSQWSSMITFTPTNSYSVTINRGTTTNDYVPVYGLYVDDHIHSQFIIPADSLTALQFGSITKLTFHASTTSVNWGNAKFRVFLSTADATTLSELADTSDMTVVYHGSLSISNNTMVVELDPTMPFVYEGGNLMIAFEQPTSGSWISSNWYGVSADGASFGGYGTSVSQQNFLPKMTITYIPGEAPSCEVPSNFAITDTTGHTASFTWEGDADYIEYKKATEPATAWVSIAAGSSPFTLDGLEQNTAYNARAKVVCDEGTFYSNTVNFATPLTCAEPTNVNVIAIPGSGSSVYVTWSDSAASAWQVRTVLGGDPSEIIDVDDTVGGFLLENLIPDARYTVEVRSVCNAAENDISQWVSFNFVPSASVLRPVGTETTSTSNYLPTHNFYKFCLTQQIYTPAELGAAGTISGIQFKNTGAEKTRTIDIYMSNTTNTTFASGTSWITVTEADKVFSGEVTFVNGEWTSITFDNPFTYDSTSNVVLTIDDNTGSYTSSPHMANLVYDAAGNQAIYYTNDNNNLDPTTTITTSGTPLSKKNHIRIAIGEPPACAKPKTLTVSNIGKHEATLHWVDTNAAAWQIMVNGDQESLIDATVDSVVLTSLQANTSYTVSVRAICDAAAEEISEWCIPVTFRTAVACPVPTNVRTVAGPTTAEVTWNYTADEDAEFTIYQVTGTDTTVVAENIDATTYTITGLNQLTQYRFLLQANCDEGDANYVPFTFRTLNACVIPTGLHVFDSTITAHEATIAWTGYQESYNVRYRPAEGINPIFSDSFEGGLGNWTIYTEGDAGAAWRSLDPTDGLNLDAHSGDYVASAWSWNNSAFDADNWLVSPQLPLGGILKYWIGANSSYPDSYAVLVSTTGNAVADFTNTVKAMAPADEPWTEVTIDLSAFAGQQGYIAFHHVDYDMNYLLLDDVVYGMPVEAGEWVETTADTTTIELTQLNAATLYEVQVQGNCDDTTTAWTAAVNFTTLPSCLALTDIKAIDATANSITLTWNNANDGAASYAITSGDSIVYTITNVTDTGCVVTGLEPNTQYTFSVRVFCAADDSSAIAGVIARTECAPLTELPYVENFEGDTRYCWNLVNFGISNIESYALNGNRFLYVNPTSDSSFAILPAMDTAISGLALQFNYRHYTSGNGGMMYVGYVYGDDTATFEAVDSINLATPNTSYSESNIYTFENAPAGSRMALRVMNSTTAILFDSVTVMERPSCIKPTSLAYSDVRNHSAILSWSENGTANAWQIMVNNNEDSLIAADSTVFMLTGLEADSTYTVAVRANCGSANGVSEWSAPVSFTTDVACPAPANVTYYAAAYTVEVNWDETSSDPVTYNIYRVVSGNDTLIDSNITAADLPYTITGLTPETQYTFKVQTVCSEGEADMVTFSVTTGEVCPPGLVCIGSGTSTNSYVPTYQLYNNSFTQQIYTAAEIGDTGNIHSVAFYNTSSNVYPRNLDVYMVSTTKNSFDGTSDWITVTAADKVFSGNVSFNTNTWTTIEFTTPFHFDGNSNIAIIVDDNSGEWHSSMSFRVFDAPSQAIYVYSDETNYDPTAPSSYSGTVINKKNCIRLGIGEMPTTYEVTVTVDPANAGTVAGVPVVPVAENDSVTLTATANTGYVFSSWMMEGNVLSTANPYTFAVTSDMDIVASFEPSAPVVDSFTVTLNTTAGGTVSPMGSTIVAEGASFTATATADSGYHFVNWTNAAGAAVSTSNPYTFTVTANMTLTAHFDANGSQTNYYTVTVSSADTTMGTVSSTANGQVAENTSVTATATAKAGYHFVNWTNAAGAVINATNPYTFTVTSDVTLVANFEANGTTYVEATIDASEIQYWVGNGNNQAIVAVNWANAAYAWGVKFSEASITVQGALDIIKDNDPRFNYTLGDYGLDNITFDEGQTHLSGSSAWNQLLNNEYGSGLAQNVVNNDFVKWGEDAAGIPIDSTYYQDWGWYYTYVFTMPIVPMWSYVGIQSIDMSNVYIYSVNSTIYVKGAEGQNIYIYDLNGRTIATKLNASETMAIPMAENGVYLVRVGNASAKRVIVMR